MTYRERIIKDFEYQVRKAHEEGWDFVDVTTEDGYKILELLKEKEAIVRCVDCEEVYFAGNRVPSEQSLVCGRYGMDVKEKFFCANGIRKVREDYMEC